MSVVTPSVLGQSFQGGIRGAVYDPGGTVIPGVAVTLINEGANVARSTITNESGQYVFNAVAPQTYRLRAASSGFKTYERSNLNLGTQQFLTLDITLELGSITEEIQVVADAPLIETSTANTATSLPSLLLSTLPNTGRNAFMIALTVPTVVYVGNPFYVRQQDQSTATRVSLGGGPVRGNNYLIEGVPVTDWRNRTVIFPNIEAVAEVNVQVNTYDADIGRTAGGVFNTTLKSGSNDWHGSAHIQQRPDEWGANNFFDNRAGRKPLPYYYWLWGGSAGGPIKRDKSFFWASTEGYKTGTNWTATFNLPTPLEKVGDFSETRDRNGNPVIIYDPLTTRPDPNNPGRFIRDPFPGNRIPANRINPVSRAILGLMPDPASAGSAGGINNFTSSDTLIDRAYQYTAKVDHTISPAHSVSGSYMYYDSQEPFAVYYRGMPGELADPNNVKLFRTVQAPAVNYTLTPDPTTAITLRYGYNWFKDTTVPASMDFDLAKLGFDLGFTGAVRQKTFPSITISDYRGLGGQGHVGIEWWSQNVVANYSKYIGRQNFRFGGAYRQLGLDFFDSSQASGLFSFDRAFTQQDPNRAASTSGNAIASLLLGFPASGSVSVGTALKYSTRYSAGYVQNDFRVRQNLTISYGLRFEHETDMREANNRTTVGFDRDKANPLVSKVTDPSIRDRIRGGLMYAGQDGAPAHQANPQKIKLGPRAGFAWTVVPGSVVRGGYGIFYAPIQGYYPGSNNMGALGYAATTSYVASNDGDLTPAGNITNPFPGGFRQPTGNSLGLLQNAGDALYFIDQNNEHGYVHQYSLDIQRELPGGIAFTIGYVGSQSEKMSIGGTNSTTINLNQLRPEQLALGAALQQSVPNPFFGIPEAGVLGTSRTINRGQLLRPFPHFLDVLAYRVSAGFGRYNSLTLKAERRMDQTGIGFRVNYTWSKSLDNYFGVA